MDAMTTMHAPSTGASHKVLRVLEAALLHTRFTDIVDEAALPKSTVHRILSSLIEEGYVSGDADRGYRAGRRFMSLAGLVLGAADITVAAHDVVERLVAEVDCTIHVGALSGDEMVYVIRQDSSKPYRMKSRVGLSIPLHSSGMGKAVLGEWSEAEIRGYADRTGLPARTESTITTVEGLLTASAEVNERGYALDLSENEVGTVCVSAAIHDYTGRATHGLSISSIALEHPGESIAMFAPQAIAAAAEISALLGAQRPR